MAACLAGHSQDLLGKLSSGCQHQGLGRLGCVGICACNDAELAARDLQHAGSQRILQLTDIGTSRQQGPVICLLGMHASCPKDELCKLWPCEVWHAKQVQNHIGSSAGRLIIDVCCLLECRAAPWCSLT